MKPVKALKVPVEGDCSIVTLTCLEDYQREVQGLIQLLMHGADACSVYVNEEGKIHNLPQNNRASMFMHRDDLGWPLIVGDILIVGLDDGNGNDTDVPTEVLKLFNMENG